MPPRTRPPDSLVADGARATARSRPLVVPALVGFAGLAAVSSCTRGEHEPVSSPPTAQAPVGPPPGDANTRASSLAASGDAGAHAVGADRDASGTAAAGPGGDGGDDPRMRALLGQSLGDGTVIHNSIGRRMDMSSENVAASVHGVRPPALPPVQTLTPAIHGPISSDAVRRVVNRNLGRARFCYERALAARPTLGGGLVAVRMLITDGGAVASTRVTLDTLADPGVGLCVAAYHRGLLFPSPATGAEATVVYPFRFTPPSPSAARGRQQHE